MSVRDTLSVPVVLRDVVEPVLARLVRPGELDAVHLEWRTVQVPDMSDDDVRSLPSGVSAVQGPMKMIDELRLVLTLYFGDETFRFDVAAEDYLPSAVDGDLPSVEDALFSSLQIFIVESRFGWGQLRE